MVPVLPVLGKAGDQAGPVPEWDFAPFRHGEGWL